MTPEGPHDDRVLPETRWAALAVFVILAPAAAILWFAPDRTADLWAWPVQPELMAIFLGSGYGAGAYFFWRTFRAERWHSSSPGVLGASMAVSRRPARRRRGDAPHVPHRRTD